MAVAETCIEEHLPNSTALSKSFVDSIHERFDGALRRFLMYKLRNEADAEDFVQEVYLRFIQLDNPRTIQSERAFLFATATNLLRDRSRRLKTRLDKASVPADSVTLECRSHDPACRVQYRQQLELLRCALGDLSENCQRAFWMSRGDGLSYREIADAMDISVSMVEKHISAALLQARNSLEE